jgi:hypothetical protein
MSLNYLGSCNGGTNFKTKGGAVLDCGTHIKMPQFLILVQLEA